MDRNQEVKKVSNEEDEEVYGKKRMAMLDLLLKEKLVNNSIDHKGILEEVDTFMFEVRKKVLRFNKI